MKSQATSPLSDTPLEIRPEDHSVGPTNAPITLIQYADFQCPFSAAAAPLIQQTIQEFGPQIRFVFRNFPLTHLHPFAFMASMVAEAAAEQDRFWRAHDILFRSQRLFSPDTVGQFIDDLDLQLEFFEESLRQNKIKDKIEWDQRSGLALSVRKTPSFFLNGQLYQNEWHESALKHQIERLLSH